MNFLKEIFFLIVFHLFILSVNAAELIDVFVVPEQELIVIQWRSLNNENLKILLINSEGKSIQNTQLPPGSTIAYFETLSVYDGEYTIVVSNGKETITHKLNLKR